MHPELAHLVRKHALSAAAAADLEALLGRSGTASTLLLDGGDTADPREGAGGQVEPEGERYEDLGPIGQGAMGEVRRVRDTRLRRTLARKILRAPLLQRPTALARFVEEAQATAQLQHPSIVPVHDIGRMPDGRVWFTMKEVRGQTLSAVIAEVHAASGDRWEPGPSGWTFRRLLTAFHTACLAVAYAHERGVVHRDLKPENVMVGGHGEVYVLDWGLAKVVGRPDLVAEAGELDLVQSGRSGDQLTRVGQVAGTPAYMPPEQARGEIGRIDVRSDVYALGAMLYEILSGRPPYQGSARAVLAQVLSGPPEPVGRATGNQTLGFDLDVEEAPAGPPLPEALVAVCQRAMAREPEARFPDAVALAGEVQAWLDGSKRREQALQVVERALEGVAEAEALLGQAAALRQEAEALLEGVEGWEPEARKAPGWARAAEAEAAEQAARLKEIEVDEHLQGALRIAPDLVEAHAALATRHRRRHQEAEAARDRRGQDEARTRLETHLRALPERNPVRREVTAYLKGDGALTLVTDPPGAEVLLYRYVERDRRLVEVFERSLGTTPLRAVPVGMGSYLCVLRHPDREEVRYPVEVLRRGHWDGVPPGEDAPHPVWLPPKAALGPDEVYIPAGWFRAGGDPEVTSLPAMRLWCDALVMHRTPITNRRYIAFLEDLVARGREAEAMEHAPRARAGVDGEQGALLYAYAAGRFSLRQDPDGDLWLPDWPVLHVSWQGARAYLEWLAERTGRPWRLPGELEREKAARGVDGRWYPWGDPFDPSWCCMMDSHRGRPLPVAVDRFPVDRGPHGVRGLAGNVQDWCVEAYDAPPSVVGERVVPPEPGQVWQGASRRVCRGGTWSTSARTSRSATRGRSDGTNRSPIVGFRGVYRLT